MKLRFLMSHCGKNWVRDKVVGKKRVYSDTERNTLHRQSVSHRWGWEQPWSLVWLVIIGRVISHANEWEDYSNYLWEGAEISRIWATAHSLVFTQCLGTVMAPPGVLFHLLIQDEGLVLSASLVPSDLNWFMLCPWAMSFFQKSCPAPFPPITLSLVQLLSRVQLFVTPWTAAHQASLSITNSQSLLRLMSIESVMPSNHLILCRPLLLQPSIFPSIRVFSNESVLGIRWPNYWSFSFSISPSN